MVLKVLSCLKSSGNLIPRSRPKKLEFKCFDPTKEINDYFHKKSSNFHDPWVGTDTTGPGEAVFAIRFDAKPVFLLKILNFRTPKNP